MALRSFRRRTNSSKAPSKHWAGRSHLFDLASATYLVNLSMVRPTIVSGKNLISGPSADKRLFLNLQSNHTMNTKEIPYCQEGKYSKRKLSLQRPMKFGFASSPI